MFTYCDNNAVNNSDPTGHWKVPNWAKGALAVAGGVCQVIAGVALCSAVGWTGVGAVLGAALIVNGSFAVIAGAAQVSNAVFHTDFEEQNLLRVAAGEIGKAIGGETGESVGETVYDVGDTAAALYSIVGGGPEALSKTVNAIGKTNKITKSISLSFAEVSKFTNNYEIKLVEGASKCIKLPKPWIRAVDGVGAGIDAYNQGKRIVGKMIEIFGGE